MERAKRLVFDFLELRQSDLGWRAGFGLRVFIMGYANKSGCGGSTNSLCGAAASVFLFLLAAFLVALSCSRQCVVWHVAEKLQRDMKLSGSGPTDGTRRRNTLQPALCASDFIPHLRGNGDGDEKAQKSW